MRPLDSSLPLPSFSPAAGFIGAAKDTVHQARVVALVAERVAKPTRGEQALDEDKRRLGVLTTILGSSVARNHEALASSDQAVDATLAIAESGASAALEHVVRLRRESLVLARATAKAERTLAVVTAR